MRTLLLLLAFTIGFLQYGFSQEPQLDGSKREQLQALKVGYLTEKLQLTPDEAQVFWPLYNELEDKVKTIRRERRKNRKSTKENHVEMSDDQLMAAVEGELDFEQQELDLKKEYTQKFKKILPIKKVVLLHHAQEDFKRRLLKGAKERRGPGRQAPH
jgi:hypothetical protein